MNNAADSAARAPRRPGVLTMLRRLAGAAAAAAMAATAAVAAPPAPEGFTMALVGDLLLGQAPARTRDEKAVAAILRSADVAIGNAETPIVDLRDPGLVPASHGSALTAASPEVAPYLGEIGLDLVSLANNHAMNFGPQGARETIRRLAAAGVQSAGFGESRSAARAAAFTTSGARRVALVAATSTYARGTEATEGVGGLRGAPGLSVLRTTRTDIVAADQMAVLRAVRESHNQGVLAEAGPTGPDEVILNNARYRAGAPPATTYAISPDDERDLIGAIRTGRQRADLLVASLHHHEEPSCETPATGDAGSGWPCAAPADFVEKIAHAAIDAGADAWLGHGPHVLLGIEIYKGKPIFYSLGNLFMQPEASLNFKDRYPAGLDPSELGDFEIFRRLFSRYTRDETLYESVIAVSRYDGDRLAEIRLYPLDLQWKAGLVQRGAPRRASREMSQKVLRRLQAMSARYGTIIAIENDIGVIRLK